MLCVLISEERHKADIEMSTFLHHFSHLKESFLRLNFIQKDYLLKMRRTISLTWLLVCCLTMMAQKIDFNKGGRPESEGLEDGYEPWVVDETETATKTFGGVTITLSCDKEYAGETVMSNYWKQGVTNGAKLVGDAVIAYKNDHGNITSGAVKLDVTISGLSAGSHSLQAFHNNIDGFDPPKLDVYVNGMKQLEGVEQTNRQTSASTSGKSYVEFRVNEGETVTVSYVTTPEPDKTYGSTTVSINALVFNEADNTKVALDPYPAKGDVHADADDGTITLRWLPSSSAVKHHVYVGHSEESLSEVSVTTAITHPLQGLNNHTTYYWRVDEEDGDGHIHQGECWYFRPRHLAFPGAEGYGRFATGGRDGIVYHVTSLDDDALSPQPGTFRYGATVLSGPRTIVFDVGGIITLKSRLSISDPYITIAGQTAPGAGILFRGCALGINHESIARFIRLYLGGGDDWDGKSPNPHTSDGIGAAGCNHTIIDHCSIAWTIDEGFSSRNAKNLTLQRTMISEALNYCGHSHYAEEGSLVSHGYAATIGAGQAEGTVGSFHHNLLAHNEGRNWSISGGLDGGGNYDGHHDIFNNVVYNWGGRASDGGTHELNFVNNYYKKGPATSQNYLLRHQFEGTGKGTQSAYVSGNIREELNGKLTYDKEGTTYTYDLSGGQQLNWEPWSKAPFFPSYATIESAEASLKNVLSDVGCNMPLISNHDERIISETLSGTTSTTGYYTKKKGLIDREMDSEGFDGLNISTATREADWDTDQDGIPNWFEALTGTDPQAPNNNADPDGDGYTDLEDYLNWIAAPHFQTDGMMEVDLSPYFAGYRSPTYQVVHPLDGVTATITNSRLTVTPSASAPKLFVIEVKATEGGITLTRAFHFANPNGTTEIANIADTNSTSPTYYDLSGRRVSQPSKGLYIHQGKKVIHQ